MQIIQNVFVNGFEITPNIIHAGTRGSFGVSKINFVLSSDWDYNTCKIVFHPNHGSPIEVVYTGVPVEIPAEIMKNSGMFGYVVSGLVKTNEGISKTVSFPGKIEVSYTLDDAGKETTGFRPSAFEQILAILGDIQSLNVFGFENIIDAIKYLRENSISSETDPTVHDWAKQPKKPTYTASEVGADPSGTASGKVREHNVDESAHNDLRILLGELKTKVENFLDVDDVTADELSEVIDLIRDNSDLIEGITKNKVNVADIINNLVTNVSNKPLSAAQGVVLKQLIDEINKTAVRTVNGKTPDENGNVEIPTGGDTHPVTSVNGKTGDVNLNANDVGALPDSTKIPAKTSDITNDSGFITKAVADLVNYYTKSQSYTKDEVNNLVSSIPKFGISVVSSLPTSNVSENTIYLLGGGNSGDLYTEYIYVNGKWEILGSQRVDLTGYATETWVDSQLLALAMQFAEEMPTKLPNPEALTINGTEYDGSKAVDITVTGGTGIHIGPEPPENGEEIWIDTDEEAENTNGGASIDVMATVGQTIVVKEVDENGKPTAWESADYQPRTHYSEVADLFSETTLTLDDGFAAAPADFVFTVGETYKVKYNGTEYDCTAFIFVGEEGVPVVGVGNGGALGEYEDTGEPFFALIADGMIAIIAFEEITEIVIGIKGTKVVTVPKEYLPKMYAEISLDESEFPSGGSIVQKNYDTTNIVDAILNNYPIYINYKDNNNVSSIPVSTVTMVLGSNHSCSSVQEGVNMLLSAGMRDKSNMSLQLYGYECSVTGGHVIGLILNASD